MTQKEIKDVIMEKQDGISLVSVIFNDGTKGSIPLKDNKTPYVKNSVQETIDKILTLWGNKRIQIANQYVSDERLDYAFLYDLIALANYVTENPNLKSLIEIKEGTILMHNRISAQILLEYSKVGYNINPNPKQSKRGLKNDFDVDPFHCEVKTIQVFGKIEHKALGGTRFTHEFNHNLSRKIEEKFDEALEQVGRKGVIFIAPWSYVVNGMLLKYFEKIKSAL